MVRAAKNVVTGKNRRKSRDELRASDAAEVSQSRLAGWVVVDVIATSRTPSSRPAISTRPTADDATTHAGLG